MKGKEKREHQGDRIEYEEKLSAQTSTLVGGKDVMKKNVLRGE